MWHQKSEAIDSMKYRRALLFASLLYLPTASSVRAESVAVTCSILPGELTASASMTNPLDYDASCLANCKFGTAVYDDNPQIICAKPVPAGKTVEMCVLKAASNKLEKVIEGLGDCRKL